MKKFIFTFLILSIFLFLCSAATASIPRESIQEHLLESLRFSYEKSMTEKYTYPTYIDHDADEILLNIIYFQDAKKPFTSALLAPYYMDVFYSSTNDLIDGIQNNVAANQEYSRYWHGSIVLLKPLLVFFSLEQISQIFVFLFYLLWIVLLFLLFRKKHFAAILFLGIAFFLTNSYIVPFCFEYLWTYLLMLILSILVLNFDHSKFPLLFFSFGILTCFLDFLTTETLVFTLPLFLVLLQKRSNPSHSWKEDLKLIGLLCLSWGIGYILMWLLKWGLALIFLKIDFTESILIPIKGRTITPTDNLSNLWEYGTASILRNINCLIPFSQIGAQWILPFLILIILPILYFAFKNPKKALATLPFLLIATIPYLRYFFITEHSYVHDFFTYRAQLVSILCFFFILRILFSRDKEKATLLK